MKIPLHTALLLATALLAGCGSMVRSNVTTFNEWPAQLPANTYVFERTEQKDASLEYRSYENLVRAQLNRIGLQEAGPNTPPYLKVNFNYGARVRDVREVYPVNVSPMWYGPGWGMNPFYSPFYDPFYDPFWYGPGYVQMREDSYQVYALDLSVAILRAANDNALFQARVTSEGKLPPSTAMPYLIYSAFKDFPGPNGVTREVDLKVK